MNRFERRVTLRVLVVHAAIVLFLLLQSALQGCFRPKPREEIVTFIEFGSPAPPAQMQEVDSMDDPPPARETPPAQETPPEQEAPPPELTVPQPDIPEPQQVEISRETPTQQVVKQPEQPAWKPTAVEIQPRNRINPPPTRPKINIEEELAGIVGGPASPVETETPPRVGNPNENNAYLARIRQYFEPYFNEPSSVPPSLSAAVRINILKNGTITKRTLVKKSSSAALDQAAMAAIRAVNSVPKPPAGYPYDYIEIEFRTK